MPSPQHARAAVLKVTFSSSYCRGFRTLHGGGAGGRSRSGHGRWERTSSSPIMRVVSSGSSSSSNSSLYVLRQRRVYQHSQSNHRESTISSSSTSTSISTSQQPLSRCQIPVRLRLDGHLRFFSSSDAQRANPEDDNDEKQPNKPKTSSLTGTKKRPPPPMLAERSEDEMLQKVATSSSSSSAAVAKEKKTAALRATQAPLFGTAAAQSAKPPSPSSSPANNLLDLVDAASAVAVAAATQLTPSKQSTTSPGTNSLSDPAARHIALDFDRDMYKQIRKLQSVQQETMRKQMATNIHRALWGNVIICAAKFGAWAHSGSAGMLAEFFHSVVDCGNQALLLVGLRDSKSVADGKHPYGYGKSVYFWALVSALGTFFLGAGVSMTHSIGNLMNPGLEEITWHVWGVLALGFAVDGYVFCRTIYETMETKPPHISAWKHLSMLRDPATLAILMEDGGACLGILMALAGIAASHYTGDPIYDGIAGIGISALLGCMGLALVRVNYRFLLGQAVDQHILDDIEKILLKRRSIDGIGSVQSQWTGPETFSYKAEIDFDGTYIAAKLMAIYQQEFLEIRDSMEDELQILLALYAEDVMRTVEREVRHVETLIRKKYPGAEYIELEPMSLDADRLAIDDNLEAELRRVESEALDRYLKMLNKENASPEAAARQQQSSLSSSRAPNPSSLPQGHDAPQ